MNAWRAARVALSLKRVIRSNPDGLCQRKQIESKEKTNMSEPSAGTVMGEPNSQGFIGRPLTDHKNNKFNRDCIAVTTADFRSDDNAHHAYKIAVYPAFDANGCREPDVQPLKEVVLEFQNGGLKEVGPNGITDQALLAIVLDRLRSFNEGPYRSRENSMMITKLEEALMWGEKRGNDRARRNVEGERIA